MSVGLSNPGLPSAHNIPSGPVAQPSPGMMNPSSMPNANGGTPMPAAGPQQSAGFPTLDFGAPQGQPTQQYAAPGFQPQSAGNVMPQQPFVPPAPQAPQQVLGGQSLTAGQFQQPQYQPQYAPAPGVTAAPAYLPQVQQAPQYGAQPYAPPAAPATTLLRDSMAQQGYTVGHYTSDAELLRDLGDIASKGLNAQRELEAIQQRNAWAQSQQGAPPQQGQPQGQGSAPNAPQAPAGPQREQAPEWSPEWDSLVRLDTQTNTYVPINAHVNPQLAVRANEVASWRRKRSAALLADPISVIAPDLEAREKKLRDDLRQELRTELQVERRNSEADAQIKEYTTANAAAFVQMDQNGKPVVSITGAPVLTPKGQAFYAHVNDYKQRFKAFYGQEPDRLDLLQHVKTQLAADEAAGKFGPSQQQPMVPGMQQVPGYPQQQQFAPQVPGQFFPQVTPQYPAQPQMPSYGGQSLAAYNPYAPAQYGAQPQQFMAPQFQAPAFGTQPMAPMQSPQDAMVARALANNAGYQPQPNGTIVANYLNPLIPQTNNLDLKQMFAQEAQARGLPTDAFTQ
jgi:hypothetical protein